MAQESKVIYTRESKHNLLTYLQQVNDPDIVTLNFGVSYVDKTLLGLTRSDMMGILARPSNMKCLGLGTKITMYDGTLKDVQNIKVGDLVMGPDSKPRKVLSTTSGQSMMYWIRQKHGIDYRVNAAHILSLKRSKNEWNKKHGEIQNISVNDILYNKSKSFLSRWKGYKVGIDFPEQELEIDPYFLGLWLGDGTSSNSSITAADTETLDGSTKNSLQGKMRKMGLLNNKHIPQQYFSNSRKNRLELLAGIIDSDGTLQKNQYTIMQKNFDLIKQIKRLADSLGFRAGIYSTLATLNGETYRVYGLCINGNIDEIPTKVRRKQKSKFERRDWQLTDITIEEDRIDNYYGFELDGDGLFLLEDMTVTHNSSMLVHYAIRGAYQTLKLRHTNQSFAPPLFITAESPVEELSIKVLSNYSNIDSRQIRNGQATNWQQLVDDVEQMTKVCPILYAGHSVINPRKGLISISFIEDAVYEVTDKFGMPPRVILVDYLQRIASPGHHDRRMGLSEVIERLKDLHMSVGAPLVFGSQAKREVDDKQIPIPESSDGKETGSIEETADILISTMRPIKYWELGAEIPKTNPTQIVTNDLFFMKILKQRNGESNEGFWISADPRITMFTELETNDL